MNKEDAKQLADQAITALQEELKAGRSESLLRYLDSMSRFHSYSWTNSLLIMLQNPEATLVAGFQRWLRMGRHVRKGEKGIGIMAPLVYRNRSDSSDQHSGPSPEATGKGERTIRGFKMVHVFDVSQTEVGTALSRPAVPAVCLRAWGGALIPLLDFLRKIQLN